MIGGAGVLVGFQEELGIRWLRPVRRLCGRLAARWGPVLARVGSRLLASALTAPFQKAGTLTRIQWWVPFRRPFTRSMTVRGRPARRPPRANPARRPPVRRWPVRWSPLRRPHRPSASDADAVMVRAVGRAPVPGRTVPRTAQRLASQSVAAKRKQVPPDVSRTTQTSDDSQTTSGAGRATSARRRGTSRG